MARESRLRAVRALGIALLVAAGCGAAALAPVRAAPAEARESPAPETIPAVPSDEEAAREVLRHVYGADLDRVAATRDGADDAVLAKTLLKAAAVAGDQRALVTLLCEKAVELGARDPSGLETAERALRILQDEAPEKAATAKALLLPAYREAYAKADPRDAQAKAAAAETLIGSLLEAAQAQAKAGEVDAALRLATEAARAARAVRSDERMQEVAAAQKGLIAKKQAAATLVRLKRVVAADPANQAARKELVETLLVEFDNPAEAARYLDGLEDEALRRYVPAAAKGTKAAPETACVEMGDWYRQLAQSARAGAKPALYARAQGYYARFLELHEAQDLDRTKAELALRKMEAELAKLGGAPSPETRAAGALRLPRKVGLLCQYAPSGTSLSAGFPLLSADGRYLAARCDDGSMRTWQVETGKELRPLPGGGPPLQFSPDGRYLVANLSTPGIRVYDMRLGTTKWEMPGVSGRVTAKQVAFSKDGKVLMLDEGGSVAKLDIEIGNVLVRQKTGGTPRAAAFRSDGSAYYLMDKGGNVAARDFASNQTLWEWNAGHGHEGSLVVSADGKSLVAVWNQPPRAYLLGAADGRLLGSADLAASAKQPMPRFGVTRDGQQVWVLGGVPATVRLLDLRSGKQLGTVSAGRGYDSIVSPDGRRVAMIARDGKGLLVAEVESGRPVVDLGNPRRTAKPFAWTPDGRYLFACQRRGAAYLLGIGPWR